MPAHHLVPVLGVQLDHPPLLRASAARPCAAAVWARRACRRRAGSRRSAAPPARSSSMPSSRAISIGRPPDPLAVAARVAVLDVDGLHQRPDRGLMGGALTVVLGEHPAGDVHRQQHEAARRRARTGCATARPSSARRARAQMTAPATAYEQAPPGRPQRAAFRGDQDAAVERGQHRQKASAAAGRGEQRIGEVGREPAGAEPASRTSRMDPPSRTQRAGHQQRVHMRGGPDGQGQLSRVPASPRAACRCSTRPSSAPGSGDERGGGGRQQKGGGEQTGKKASVCPGTGWPRQRQRGGVLADGVEHGERQQRVRLKVAQARRRAGAAQHKATQTAHVMQPTRGPRQPRSPCRIERLLPVPCRLRRIGRSRRRWGRHRCIGLYEARNSHTFE